MASSGVNPDRHSLSNSFHASHAAAASAAIARSSPSSSLPPWLCTLLACIISSFTCPRVRRTPSDSKPRRRASADSRPSPSPSAAQASKVDRQLQPCCHKQVTVTTTRSVQNSTPRCAIVIIIIIAYLGCARDHGPHRVPQPVHALIATAHPPGSRSSPRPSSSPSSDAGTGCRSSSARCESRHKLFPLKVAVAISIGELQQAIHLSVIKREVQHLV